MSRSIWRTLGISATHDQTAIRRAYAARLRVTNPEDDPAGFQTLRGAYDQAMGLARRRAVASQADLVAADVMAASEPPEPAEADGLLPTRPPVAVPVPPPPSVDERQRGLDELDRLCGRLHGLVTEEGVADHAAIRDAGAAVLAAPALDEITVHGRVDAWLQSLIAYNIPRSDPLIDLAAAHFGWAQQAGRLQTSGAIEHILLRQDDIGYRRRLRSKDHFYNRPYRMLERPPRFRSPLWRWTTITRENEVREFLRHLADAHPTIHADLNQETLTWWRERLTGPRFSRWSLSITLMAAGFGFLFGLGGTSFLPGFRPSPFLGGIANALLAGGAAFGLLLGRLYAVDVARVRWRREWSDTAPDWVRFGWAPAALGPLLLGACLPPAWPSVIVVSGLTLGVMLWARAVDDKEPPAGDAADIYGPLLWSNAYLLPVWLLMLQGLEPLNGLQMAIPFVGLTALVSRNVNDLHQYWRRLVPKIRRRTFSITAGLIVVAGLTIGLAGENTTLQALAAALTGGIVLTLRAPAQAHSVVTLRVRYISNGVLAVAGLLPAPLLFERYSGSPWLLICGALLLTGALVSLVASAVADRRSL